ncbi:MAG: YgiT-type zinc finger protein [Anaerolineales bacterium]|nr:YgiT-type zinc finger protein [Anaerolineales bacterium]MCA9928715.1 YgiT-type zinc finger protein [Anaerolineales bacterium]
MSDQCSRCRIGRLQTISTPYLTKINGHIMVVPDSPAYHCDMCGSVRYDEQFLENIEQLVDQFAETSLVQETYHPIRFGDVVDQSLSTRRSS